MKNNYKFKQLFNWLVALVFISQTMNIYAQSNQYLHFDKVDDFVEVVDASKFIANASGVTMAAWFYCDELEYGQGMMSFRNGGSGDGQMYMIQLADGKLENRYITSTAFSEYVSPNFTVIPEVWQHYAWVYDGSSVLLYLDGQLVGSTPSSSGPITSQDTPLSIGSHISPFNFYFGGRIDEFSLWSKGLSQTEIQDMINNELTGSETNLELYYKFNQGVPGDDNTSITKLVCEVPGTDREGDLMNFTLDGPTSNFGGELDDSFQAISFPQIPNKLVTDADFSLEATASSNLPVSYEVLSGPASVNGSVITLDGTPGEVVVRASQEGDATYGAAVDVDNSFQVLDPETFTPQIDLRSPTEGGVWVPELGPIQLAAISSIDYPALFSVDNVVFEIDGTSVDAKDWNNDHYTGWWTPPSYGTYTMNITSTNNYGYSNTESFSFIVSNTMSDVTANAGTNVHLDVNTGEATVTIELPSYMGAFDQIMGNLTIDCPGGGCDPWDRISGVEVKGHNGTWYEIIRYITPYGIACNHSIDLTDFMSLLQGKVDFRFYLGTQGNGFLYTLDLDYNGGIPTHKYSTVDKLWNNTYDFGNMDNLQPCDTKGGSYPAEVLASKIKLVSTGHGWGNNNTGNAAEFHEDTHHVWVNGTETFAQHNWNNCDPNPDGCNDQFGTWEFDRAGWCPGSIAPWFDFDMTPYISGGNVELKYIFDEDYVDLCHVNNPNCVSGTTCDNCNDGFNPHLIVASYLISLGDEPLNDATVTKTEDVAMLDFKVYPNPTTGTVQIEMDESKGLSQLRVLDSMGRVVRVFDEAAPTNIRVLHLNDLPNGIYFVELTSEQGRGLQKLTLMN